MEDRIRAIFEESIAVKQASLESSLPQIVQAAEIIIEAIKNGAKVILFGNGGSAADSQHMAAELVGRFQKNRKALPAIALTTNTSSLTALGNDFGYETVFTRQVEALANPGDVAIGISTSGNSANVIEAIKTAKNKGLKTVSLTGGQGGALAALAHVNLNVAANNTARIQETHICIIHCICELVENSLC